MLRLVDVLVVNETEALALADRPPDGVPPGTPAWIDLADELRRGGPSAYVITLGNAGAVVHDGTDGWAQPPFAAAAVDSTGAGDAFCGALAAGLAAGTSLAEAVRRGCAAGALATERLGAQSALPIRAELERLVGGM